MLFYILEKLVEYCARLDLVAKRHLPSLTGCALNKYCPF